MRTFLLLIGLLGTSISFAQHNKTIWTTFDTDDITNLSLKLNDNIKVVTHNSNKILIQTTITSNDKIATKYAIKKGDFKLSKVIKNQTLTIIAKDFQRQVYTKKGIYAPAVSYIIYVPKGLKVN